MTNREISIPKVIAGLAVVMLISVAGAGAETPTRLTEVAVSTIQGSTYIMVTTGGTARYRAKLVDPNRLVVDFEDTKYQWRTGAFPGTGDPIEEIQGSQFKKDVARLVVHLSRPVRYTIEREANGIVIALADRASTGRPAPRAAPKVPAAPAPATEVAAGAPPASSIPASTAPPAKLAAPATLASAPVRLAQAQPPPPTPPAPGIVRTTDGRRLISLDFKDADVVNLLRILAAESGRNIVIGDDVKGKMSISLRNVPWEQALDTILETRGLQKIETGNVLRIVTTEQLTREREAQARVQEAKVKTESEARARLAEAQLKEAQALQQKYATEAAVREAEARGPLREESIRLSYADPNEVADTLIGILGLAGAGGAQLKPCGQEVIGGGASAAAAPGTTPPPIAEPPFSQMYGQAQAQLGAAAAAQGAAAAAQGAAAAQSGASSRGLAIRSHCPTHTLFLRLYSADLERIKKLIRESFDIPLPQVKIEARMEILDRNALEQIGIQWGGAAVGRSGSLALVGQGLQSGTVQGQGVPTIPGVLLPDGSVLIDRTPVQLGRGSFTDFPNPNTTLSGFLPISQSTGLPLGGNLINLPISALPTSGALPAAGLAFGIVAQKFNINLALQALAQQGKTRTLARPEIVTVENNKAIMSLGEEIPYATVSSAGTQIQFKEALLKLEVTPTVIREGELNKIKMLVIVENNSRGREVSLGNSGNPPAINKRRAETLVLIQEGHRLVIGGVVNSRDANTVRKVPILGDMPLIGWLFKQKETSEDSSELVVFVTPSILRAADGSIPAPAPSK
jgi:type II secretory pathway component GspD/PulD (secretin)